MGEAAVEEGILMSTFTFGALMLTCLCLSWSQTYMQDACNIVFITLLCSWHDVCRQRWSLKAKVLIYQSGRTLTWARGRDRKNNREDERWTGLWPQHHTCRSSGHAPSQWCHSRGFSIETCHDISRRLSSQTSDPKWWIILRLGR